ncbi:PspC domain-containing protein [Nocardia sp. NPDC051750]|uniref:PspC domain-containing protein n=1 Tax=Nocardia sp. NPDC051750 TaxID=3364325 RepID=UPI00378B9C81
MTRTSFGEQVQQLWQTRPARLPRQGPIAGVAAGFGHRYGIDPVLVRIAFVVSTIFGGAGVVLYLVGWLLFPEPGEDTSMAESLTRKRRDSQSQTKTIVLIVALAIAVSTMGPVGVGLGGSGVIALALMLAGWWMLYLRSPLPPPLPPGAVAPESLAGPGTTGYPGTAFPQTGADPYTSQFTGVYTPYTKLPDRYVPDTPAASGPQSGEADSGRVPPEAASGSTGGPQLAKSTGASAEPATGSTTAAPDAAQSTARPTTATGPAAGSTTPDSDPAGSASSSSATADPATASPGRPPEAPGVRSSALRQDEPTAAQNPEKGTTSETNPGHDPGTNRPGGPRGTVEMRKPTGHGLTDRTPPSWDPLGVAPLAWDLPEPAPERSLAVTTEKRPRSRFTAVVLGLAILAAAGAGAAAVAGAEWMTPGRIAAVALAVIALGLMLGAFRRRGHGLLLVTAPLAAFVILAAAIGPVDFQSSTMGERTWAPASAAEVRPDYAVTMGSGTLDLRGIELTADKTVDLSVQMGEAVVLVPENMNVRTECTVRMGDANCPDGLTGPGGDSPVLNLNVQVRMGEAEVRRG